MTISQITVWISFALAAIQLLKEGISFIRERATHKNAEAESLSDTMSGITASQAKLLNLSFLLFFSALISLLWINALLISGYTIDSQNLFTTSVYSLVITIGVTCSSLFMWYRKKTEQAMALWSFLTIMVLVVAPGSPFYAGLGQKAGIDLWIPVLTLFTICISMSLYVFGHPFDPFNVQKRSARVIIIIVTLVAAVSLGKQNQRNLLNAEKMPHISDDTVLAEYNLFKEIHDLPSRKLFYQLTSEQCLEENYKGTVSIIQAHIASRKAEAQREDAMRQDELNSKTRITSSYYASPKPQYDHSLPGLNFQQLNGTSSAANVDLSEQQINDLLVDFRALSVSEQREFLENRASWVHALGKKTDARVPYRMPGLTAIDRYNTIADYRTLQAMSVTENQKSLLNNFDYNYKIYSAINGDKSSSGDKTPAVVNKAVKDEGLLPVPDIFPPLSPEKSYYSDLLLQLALPTDYEAYLANNEYQILAKEICRTKIQPESSAKLDSIYNQIDSLKPDERRALVTYVYPDSSDNIFDALLALQKYDSLWAKFESDLDFKELAKLLVSPGRAARGEINDLAFKLNRNESQVTRKTLLSLIALQEKTPSVYLKDLFRPRVFAALDSIDSFFISNDRPILLKTERDPIREVVLNIFETESEAKKTDTTLVARFKMFDKLDADNKENFLHLAALSLYNPRGKNAPSFPAMLVLTYSMDSDIVGTIVSSIMCMPVVFIFFLISMFLSTRLSARDKLDELIMEEANKGYGELNKTGETGPLTGRDDIVINLKKLAGRGWSAIAMVGRRGIGKTKILQNLLHGGENTTNLKSITAWISAPSDFNEADFIESVIEQLCCSIEQVVAKLLGAKPYEIRRLELNATVTGSLAYFIFMMFFMVIFWQSVQLTEVSAFGLWIPVAITLLASAGVLIIHFSKMQPLDLTSWLERDRVNKPHVVLLYREIGKMRDFLNSRRPTTKTVRSQFGRMFVFFILGVVAILTIIFFSDINFPAETGEYSTLAAYMGLAVQFMVYVILVAACGYAVYIVFARRRSEEIEPGNSLMTLINQYRQFVSNIIYRVQKEALGKRNADEKFEVIICIDELDKVTDVETVRKLVTKIKAIFEIPGAYYYLTLSEDCLKSFYQGNANGKNEIDSSFDHVIYIPPLGCKEGTRVAFSYLMKHLGLAIVKKANAEKPDEQLKSIMEVFNKKTETEPFIAEMPDNIRPYVAELIKTSTAIASVSFGVSRDIIRLCDQLLSASDPDIKNMEVINSQRIRQLEFAHNQMQISTQLYESLIQADAATVAGYLYSTIKVVKVFAPEEDAERSTIRIQFITWIFCLLKLAYNKNDGNWNARAEKLRETGYKLPIEDLQVTFENIIAMHKEIVL